MHPLRTLGGLALGLAMMAGLASSPQAGGPAILALGAAAARAVASNSFIAAPGRGGMAEVAVAFDQAGQIAYGRMSRSSGSRATDAAALDAALELAALRRPADVAGRTLLFKTSYEAAALRTASER